MPADKPTELSSIKLKTLTRQPVQICAYPATLVTILPRDWVEGGMKHTWQGRTKIITCSSLSRYTYFSLWAILSHRWLCKLFSCNYWRIFREITLALSDRILSLSEHNKKLRCLWGSWKSGLPWYFIYCWQIVVQTVEWPMVWDAATLMWGQYLTEVVAVRATSEDGSCAIFYSFIWLLHLRFCTALLLNKEIMFISYFSVMVLTSGFPSQRASYGYIISMSWCNEDFPILQITNFGLLYI